MIMLCDRYKIAVIGSGTSDIEILTSIIVRKDLPVELEVYLSFDDFIAMNGRPTFNTEEPPHQGVIYSADKDQSSEGAILKHFDGTRTAVAIAVEHYDLAHFTQSRQGVFYITRPYKAATISRFLSMIKNHNLGSYAPRDIGSSGLQPKRED